MPQLMPLYWICSMFIMWIMFFMGMLIYYYSNSFCELLSFDKLYKNKVWKW